MHHVVMDRWSRGTSVLHRRDARAKTIAALVFLITLATAHRAFPALSILYFVVLCSTIQAARLPLGKALKRAAIVLPFSLVFAVISFVAGDSGRAATMLGKSYLSALAVLLLVSATPLPELLRGLESLGVPRFLLMVIQFLYRYLFVISEEAQHMRAAARAKSGSVRRLLAGRSRFRSAAGALGVLFARSYGHAEGVHQAMLSRGFQGHFQTLSTSAFTARDLAFTATAITLLIGLRLAVEVWV